jgi:hypothetical protein
MRKLPLLLVLLLLSLCLLAAAASAHAAALPATTTRAALLAASSEDEEAGDEAEAGNDEGDEAEEAGEAEFCEAEDEEEEEEQLCEEGLEAEEAEGCKLDDASASVAAAAGAEEVRLTVHYKAFEPTPVTVDARLLGSKGGLHLGSKHVRFLRSGVYRDSFGLSPRQMTKALAAHEFEVDLHAAGTPADCALHLSSRVARRAR